VTIWGIEMSCYYIQNKKSIGNCMIFWRIDGHGYTCNLDEAWIVTKEKAEEICRSRPKEDIPRLCYEVDKLSQRHCDVQNFPSAVASQPNQLRPE
jgi:hypothetical protein